MGYNNPTTDLGWIRSELLRLNRRVDELTRPGAGQLNKTVGFLASLVTVTDAKTNANTLPEQGSVGDYIFAFDSTYDPSVTVDVATGNLAVTVSSVGYLDALSGLTDFVGGVYPDVVSVSSPTASDPGHLVSFEGGAGYLNFGGSFTRYYSVTPGTYTVRCRRGFLYGGSSADFDFTTTYRAIAAQVIP